MSGRGHLSFDNQQSQRVVKLYEELILNPHATTLEVYEVNFFTQYSKYITCNYSKLQIVGTLYEIVRLLIPPTAPRDFRRKTLIWLILCEEWPFRVCCLLDTAARISGADMGSMSIHQFYEMHVKDFVHEFKTKAAAPAPDPCSLLHEYHKALLCEREPLMLIQLLKESEITVKDLGALSYDRDELTLLSYSINIRTGLSSFVRAMNVFRSHVDPKHIEDGGVYNVEVAPKLPDSDLENGRSETVPSRLEQSKEDSSRNQDNNKLLALESLCESGLDHVGLSHYAVRLAHMMLERLDSPYVMGLFGRAACRTSALAELITAHLQAMRLVEVAARYYKDDERICLQIVRLLGNIMHDDGDRRNVKMIKKLLLWLRSDSDMTYVKVHPNGGFQIDSVGIKKEMQRHELQWLSTEITCFLKRFSARVKMCFAGARKTVAIHEIEGEQGITMRCLENLLEAYNAIEDFDMINYEVVSFNSWSYRGTDNMWASFVTVLQSALERHFGPYYYQSEKKALFILLPVKLFAIVVVVVIALILIQLFGIARLNDSRQDITSYVVSVSSVLAVLGTAGSYAYKYIFSVSDFEAEMADLQVTDKLGYMAAVSKSVTRIGKIMQHPKKHLWSVWDYILPSGVSNILAKFKWIDNKRPRPGRFVIVIHDLDMMSAAVVVEVLRVISLLTERGPFIVLLTGDEANLVKAIEATDSVYFSGGLRSGWDYLDTLITARFNVPPMTQAEKDSFYMSFFSTNNKIKALGMEGDEEDIDDDSITIAERPGYDLMKKYL